MIQGLIGMVMREKSQDGERGLGSSSIAVFKLVAKSVKRKGSAANGIIEGMPRGSKGGEHKNSTLIKKKTVSILFTTFAWFDEIRRGEWEVTFWCTGGRGCGYSYPSNPRGPGKGLGGKGGNVD